MSRIIIDLGSKILICRRKNTRKMHNRGRTAPFEQLGERVVLSVTASFSPDTGVLTVFGDSLNNNIVVSRNAAGNILINGGSTAVAGGAPTVVNARLIQVFGQGGNDTLSLDEANGALPAANLFGGAGNDILTGGSGNDMLFGDRLGLAVSPARLVQARTHL